MRTFNTNSLSMSDASALETHERQCITEETIITVLDSLSWDEDKLWYWIGFEEDMMPVYAKGTNEQVEIYNAALEYVR